MIYIGYLKFPKIPNELIIDLSAHISDKIVPYRLVSSFFKTVTINPELMNWLSLNLPVKIVHARYQIIFNGITKHKDSPDRVTAINYLLDSGGVGVMTNVYDDSSMRLQSEIIEINKWHYISTNLPHDVTGSGFVRPRLAISIDSVKSPEQLFDPTDIA